MKILFFGKLRDTLGNEREIADQRIETVAQLRRRLADLYPEAANHLLGAGVRVCVDNIIVSENFIVDGQNRVEFFSPLSGG